MFAWTAIALAVDPGAELVPVEAWIAPGPFELSATLVELERRVHRAEVVGEAAERLQNQWGLARATGQATPCEAGPAASALAARILVFGPAWRDDVQAARAEAERLAYLVVAPTVVPLLDPDTRSRVDRAVERTEHEVSSYSAFAAWHQRYFLPSARGCELRIGPAAGIPNGAPAAPEELGSAVAIVAIGGGVVCPVGLPADGRVAVLPGPVACMGGDDCACDPLPVDPGAVLFGR